MKFRKFISEFEEIQNTIGDIKQIVSDMDEDELNDFGSWLYSEIFDDDDVDDDFTLDEIIELISSLPSEDADYVLYMLGGDDDDIDNVDTDITEITQKFLAKNRNKKKNKRFTKTKAEFRATKAARKRDNRKNRVQRKKNYRKNKIKIKKYEKSYNKAVKSGKHFKKIRR